MFDVFIRSYFLGLWFQLTAFIHALDNSGKKFPHKQNGITAEMKTKLSSST